MSIKFALPSPKNAKQTPHGTPRNNILRSHTSNANTLNSQHTSDDDNEEVVDEFFESDMARRMSKNHAKRFMPKDLYETIPFFKDIPQKDR